MSGSIPIIVFLGAAGVILAAFLYLRAEPSVPGRALLLGLRVGSLTIVMLLILDFEIPGGDPSRPEPEGGKWILVDPDLSLTISGPDGSLLWDDLLASAGAGEREGARLAVALAGDGGPEGIDLEALSARAPSVSPGSLGTAVSQLGEAGADSIVVLSTFRRPRGDIDALAAETPVPLRLQRLGASSRNVGIGELSLPATASSDEEISGRVGLFGEGALPGDSVQIELRADGELIQTLYAPVPGEGEEVALSFTLPPPPDTGLVRYTATGVLDGDLFVPDDLRARWMVSGRGDDEIMLVSLSPDWEPRVLLPVLEAVTGLEGEGYLRLEDGRFLPLVSEGTLRQPVEDGEFRDRLSDAELVVVQGGLEDPPPWLAEVVDTHPRVLHLPGSGGSLALMGLETDPALAGEWAAAADVPASPLSPFLAGISLGGLPPLYALLPLTEPMGATTGLNAQGGRGGEPVPALVLLGGEAGRRAVALADGFWRWGVRDGESRRAYRALWGGVTGWLLGYVAPGSGESVRPETVSQIRGEPLRWEVPLGASDLELSLVRVHDGGDGPWKEEAESSGELRFRGALRGDDGAVTTTPPVEPGIYRFEVRQPETLPGDSIVASGLVEVEGWAPSLRRPPLELADRAFPAAGGEGRTPASQGRPLRTHPLPYLVLLLLLGVEWVGRRRVGLR